MKTYLFKNYLFIFGIIWILSVGSLILMSKDVQPKNSDSVQQKNSITSKKCPFLIVGWEFKEHMYSEGQKDAIKGDLKIKYDSINKCWYWIKSPWEDGSIPTYNINNNIIHIFYFREDGEYAYSEGQKDAIKGDLKIKYDSINKCWYWIKSPWSGHIML